MTRRKPLLKRDKKNRKKKMKKTKRKKEEKNDRKFLTKRKINQKK